MKINKLVLALILVSLVQFPGSQNYANAETSENYKLAPGSYNVKTVTYDWYDVKRDRDVPVKIYYPISNEGVFPLIVFSHGLGGTRDGYEYLGNHWASHGYICVHPQHIGSDDAIWKDSKNKLIDLRKAADDPKSALARPYDISFVIDQVELLNNSDEIFEGKIDLNNIGLGGHSFGAWTTQATIGQIFITPRGEFSINEPRIKAAISMSPSASNKKKDNKKSFSKISIPVFHMTGTRDTSIIKPGQRAETRRVPFDNIDAPNQFLVIFEDGDHMIFSGRTEMKSPLGGKNDEIFQKLIKMSTTAFWDYFLKNDNDAGKWFIGGGFKSVLGTNGTFEKKM